MNPDPQEPAKPINTQPPVTPNASTPASDEAALQAIEALEAESAQASPQTFNDAPAFQDSPEHIPVTDPYPTGPVTYGQTLNPEVSPVDVQGATVGIPTEAAVIDPAIDAQEIEPAPLVAPAPNTPVAPTIQPESKKPGSVFTKILLVIAGLAILGAIGFFGWQFFRSSQSSDSTTPTTTPSETVPMGSMPEDEQANPSFAP